MRLYLSLFTLLALSLLSCGGSSAAQSQKNTNQMTALMSKSKATLARSLQRQGKNAASLQIAEVSVETWEDSRLGTQEKVTSVTVGPIKGYAFSYRNENGVYRVHVSEDGKFLAIPR